MVMFRVDRAWSSDRRNCGAPESLRNSFAL
jgi:hypothetical protein